MNQKLYIKDIMTADPVVIKPDDSVVYAAKILFERNFNGLPVTDDNQKVTGILTEYDLISKGGNRHLPLLINILGNLDTYKKDDSLVKDDLKSLMILKVKDIMNTDPLMIEENVPIKSVAELFAAHHKVNPILVTDHNKKLTGVISRFDLVKFFATQDDSGLVDPSHPEVLDKKAQEFIWSFDKKLNGFKMQGNLWSIVGVLLVLVGVSVGLFLILNFLAR